MKTSLIKKKYLFVEKCPCFWKTFSFVENFFDHGKIPCLGKGFLKKEIFLWKVSLTVENFFDQGKLS